MFTSQQAQTTSVPGYGVSKDKFENNFAQISEDIDQCLKIKEMMNKPLKNKAFAISQ